MFGRNTREVMCVLVRASFQGPMVSLVPLLVMVTGHLGKVMPLLCKVTISPFVGDEYLVERYFEAMQIPSTYHTFSYY